MSPLSDKAIAVLRTLVFGAWAVALGWLLTKVAIPEMFAVQIDALGQAGITWVLMSVLYPLLRKVEAKLPPWLTRILLGSNKAPRYIDQGGNTVAAPFGYALGGVVHGPGNTVTFTVDPDSVDPVALAAELRKQIRRQGGPSGAGRI